MLRSWFCGRLNLRFELSGLVGRDDRDQCRYKRISGDLCRIQSRIEVLRVTGQLIGHQSVMCHARSVTVSKMSRTHLNGDIWWHKTLIVSVRILLRRVIDDGG